MKKLLIAFAVPAAIGGWYLGASMGLVIGIIGMGLLVIWQREVVGQVDDQDEATHDAVDLAFVPDELHLVLERAAVDFARMSPSRFDESGVLHVGSTELRNLGLINSATWAQVPAHDSVRVLRLADGTLETRVLLPGLPRPGALIARGESE